MNKQPLIRKKRQMRRNRVQLVLPAFLFLSACTGEPVRFTGESVPVSADQAMIMPPAGSFAISGVTQRRYTNALQQEVFLSTNSSVSGQNVVQVRFFGTKSPMRYGDDTLRFVPLTEAGIGSELRGTLPGVAMTRSPFVTQNDYGAFGYAVGRPVPGELCLYAWQQLRSQEGPPASSNGVIQVRVRLCDRGADEAKLLSFMHGFSITGSVDAANWNPYGLPGSMPDRLGRSGAPMPATANILPVEEPAPVASRPVRRPVVATPTQVEQPVPVLPPGAERVVVPSPVRAVNTPATQPVPAPVVVQPQSPGVVVPSPTCIGAASTSQGNCP